MLTIEILQSLSIGTILHHTTEKNKDNTPIRAKINGKFHKETRTKNWRLPMKHGLRQCFGINSKNLSDWQLPTD